MPRARSARRLEILSLLAPPVAPPGRPLAVQVQAADAVGIAAVEVRLGAERHLLRAGGERVVSAALEVSPCRPGLLVVEARARGVDGLVGESARTVVAVDGRADAPAASLDAPALGRRIAEWERRGLPEAVRHARGPLYVSAHIDDAALETMDDWWVEWRAKGGGQPFDAAQHCGSGAITPAGEVLRCWLALNPLVAVSLIWDEILPSGQVHPDPYPFWPEWRKQELDQVFHATYLWLASGLQTPFPIPPDPSINQVPPTFYGTNVALNTQQAWVLYSATVAFSLALEIGGFVPWSLVGYGPEELGGLFHSRQMFEAGAREYTDFGYTGYWCGHVLPAFPKTAFRFFVDQDIIRPTHSATITRLLAWSGSHLWHYADFGGDTEGKTPMEVAYMHWQYHGGSPVQRMLAGTVRDNTSEVHHWTRGCSGTSHMYRSILRALNIPADTQWGWGEGIEPHLGGHTVPVFPTIGKTMSHGDDMLGWDFFTAGVSPPPASVSPAKLLISWDRFVDWFYTHPDANVGRQRQDEIPLEVLPDDVLDLYCEDLATGTPETTSAVLARFSKHYTHAELVQKGLWTHLAQKAAALDWCG
jgi:hypothetical protein